jgi:hypothetical protein
MHLKSRGRVAGAVALAVVASASAFVRWSSSTPPAVRTRGIVSPLPRGASALARREAIRWYGRAVKLAIGRVEGLTDWDPQTTPGASSEARRRAAIADTAELRMAIRIAERAARLATTRDDRFEAALLLSRFDCDAGLHDRELAQARLLMALAPKSFTSLKALRRAAGCNHLAALARQSDTAIEALPGSATGGRLRFGPTVTSYFWSVSVAISARSRTASWRR